MENWEIGDIWFRWREKEEIKCLNKTRDWMLVKQVVEVLKFLDVTPEWLDIMVLQIQQNKAWLATELRYLTSKAVISKSYDAAFFYI